MSKLSLYYFFNFSTFLSLFLIAILLELLSLVIFPQKVDAAELTNVLVRVDRIQKSTPTGGVVCATPVTDDTESFVQITFPPSFTVNQTNTYWGIDLSNLPSGGVAWPGIGTAVSVSGQTVTFPSDDLTVGVFYCFKFTSTNTLTVKNVDTSDVAGLVATLSLDKKIIDSQGFVISTVYNDQIQISATVPASPNDFSFSIKSLNDDELFNEDEIINYQITYATNVSYPVPLTVQAEWSLGTIEGADAPTIDILEYVVGSASRAYGGVPAVVDLKKRTITWNIPAFPANKGDQNVTFSLKTKKGFRGTYFRNRVDFNIAARIFSINVTTADEKITQTYVSSYYYRKPRESFSRLRNLTGAGEASTFFFETVDINAISPTSAQFTVRTNKPSSLLVMYGTEKDRLTSRFTSLSLSSEHKIKFEGLTPGTVYYFILEGEDQEGQKTNSELITFTTASHIGYANILPDSIVITSEKLVLLSPYSGDSYYSNSIVLPKGSTYEVKFAITASENIKQVQLFTRDSQNLTYDVSKAYHDVLGINFFPQDALASTQTSSTLEIGIGAFLGLLKVPDERGIYQIYAKISDIDGNISEAKLATIVAVDKLKVLSKVDNTPLENAKIKLYYYNPKLKLYEDISSVSTQVKSISFTEPDGTVNLVLPQGTYKAEVTAIGYQSQEVIFDITPQNPNGFPTVYLEKDWVPFISTIKYHFATLRNLANSLHTYFATLSQSKRFFDLISTVSLIIFAALTLISLSSRTHIPIHLLPKYFIHRIRAIYFKDYSLDYVEGRVIEEESHLPVSRVQVYLMDNKDNKILSVVKTDKLGHFTFKYSARSYKVLAMKNGFEPTYFEFSKDFLEQSKLVILLRKNEKFTASFIDNAVEFVETIVGYSFETLLALSMILQIFFMFVFGLERTLPFLIISILNLLFWLSFRKHEQELSV